MAEAERHGRVLPAMLRSHFNCWLYSYYMYVYIYVLHVKEGVIPTEIGCKHCHVVSNGITSCCTGIRQPRVHVLKYKKYRKRKAHTNRMEKGIISNVDSHMTNTWKYKLR